MFSQMLPVYTAASFLTGASVIGSAVRATGKLSGIGIYLVQSKLSGEGALAHVPATSADVFALLLFLVGWSEWFCHVFSVLFLVGVR